MCLYRLQGVEIMEIRVRIRYTRGASAPAYATDGSAAVDLRAALEGGTVTVMPGRREMIPTGLFIEPEDRDVVAVVAARSGLAARKGICLANGIGVIDSDYRGEILVTLLNTSDEPFTVADGDRIAQLMFMPVLRASFIEADELGETERGAGGFGSTGTK
jgi:dUTP pyrophosphatase